MQIHIISGHENENPEVTYLTYNMTFHFIVNVSQHVQINGHICKILL